MVAFMSLLINANPAPGRIGDALISAIVLTKVLVVN